MEIVIHLGLYRTGSTALQNALNRARVRLAGQGVWFAPLTEVRPAVARPLGAAEWEGIRGAAARPLVRRRLRDWAAAREAEGVERVILSDENLLGDLDPCLVEGGPYPHAAARMALLAEAFAPWPCRAAVALRETAAWTASAWAFALSRRPQPDFEAAKAVALKGERGWDAVAADIRAAFPDLTVWRSELYETRPLRVHRLLAGEPGRQVKAQVRRGNVSLSAPALEALSGMRARGETPDRAALKALAERYPLEECGGFDPWTEAERRMLSARFEAELAAIRATGVRVLPAAPGGGADGGARDEERRGAQPDEGGARRRTGRAGRKAPMAADVQTQLTAPGARRGGER